mmetsp:Transcript_13053/g.16225  ORF Transcript_13053/g.16225 Transcript_13053/m.16225 type:complete len:278 (-) Transcript_13053:42-875(-)
MEYHLDYWKGEVSMISLLIGNAFLIQSVQYLAVMYMQSMNHKLMKATFLDRLDLSVLSWLAVPYILHILNFILLILLAINWHDIWDHPIEVVRLGYGVMSIYLLIDTLLLPYYLLKLARLLEQISCKKAMRNSHSSPSRTAQHMTFEHRVWSSLAKKSRRLAYFIIIVCPVAITFILVEIDHEYLTHPHEYFFFQTLWAAVNLAFFVLYIDLLKPYGFLSTSRYSDNRVTGFVSSNDVHGRSVTRVSQGESFESQLQSSKQSQTQKPIILDPEIVGK